MASRHRRPNAALLAVPLVPAVALLLSPYLPFVNAEQLWFGVPSLFVWTSVWVLLVTPALLTVELLRPRGADEEDPAGQPTGGPR